MKGDPFSTGGLHKIEQNNCSTVRVGANRPYELDRWLGHFSQDNAVDLMPQGANSVLRYGAIAIVVFTDHPIRGSNLEILRILKRLCLENVKMDVVAASYHQILTVDCDPA